MTCQFRRKYNILLRNQSKCVQIIDKDKIIIGLFATTQLDSTYNHRYTTINCFRFNIRYISRMANYSLVTTSYKT